MNVLNYFCPYSNRFHACREFNQIAVPQKVLTIGVTILASIFLLGFGGIAAFRLMVKKYSFKKVDPQPSNPPNPLQGQATTKQEKVEQEAKKVQYLVSTNEILIKDQNFQSIFKKYAYHHEAFMSAVSAAVALLALVKEEHYHKIPSILDSYNFLYEKHRELDECVTELSIRLLEEVLGIEFGESVENAQKIALAITEKRIHLFFHGTNLEAEKHILDNGISSDKTKRDYSFEEIKEIKNIGVGSIGFGCFFYGGSKKYFYIAERIGTAYSYATTSPEWFASFAGNLQDYQKAKWKVEQVHCGGKIDSQKKKIISFFNKHWEKYGSPSVASIFVGQREKNSTPHDKLGFALWESKRGVFEERPDHLDDRQFFDRASKGATPADYKKAIVVLLSWTSVDEKLDSKGVEKITELSAFRVPVFQNL